MNGSWFFAASRRLPTSLVLLALLAVVGAALGPARFPVGEHAEYGVPWQVRAYELRFGAGRSIPAVFDGSTIDGLVAVATDHRYDDNGHPPSSDVWRIVLGHQVVRSEALGVVFVHRRGRPGPLVARRARDGDPLLQRERHHEPVVVVGVLADQVRPSGRGPHARRG